MPTATARCLRTARFEFRSREEAAAVAEFIAGMLPERIRTEFILVELMLNAVEHGNLEIKGAKAELVRQGQLEAEVARRLVDERYRDRVAWLEVTRDRGGVVLVVGDAGPGCVETESSADTTEPCGRGLALARAMSSTGLTFNSEGNIVTASVRW